SAAPSPLAPAAPLTPLAPAGAGAAAGGGVAAAGAAAGAGFEASDAIRTTGFMARVRTHPSATTPLSKLHAKAPEEPRSWASASRPLDFMAMILKSVVLPRTRRTAPSIGQI